MTKPRPTINYPKNCGHQACSCEAAPHSSYCSDACEQASAPAPGARCPCTHSECGSRSLEPSVW